MSGARAFFDASILLYMYGGDAGRRAHAQELFREHAQAGRMLLSTQVIQEFYEAGAQKLGMPRHELCEAAVALLDFPLVTIGSSHIRAAIENAERYRISFWAALILSAAESGGAEVLYTEDLNHGQRYGTVVVQNPFRPAIS